MKFHREGRVSILIASVVAMSIILFAHFFLAQNTSFQTIAFGLAVILVIVVLQFFRSPLRRKILIADALMAPADGKVVVIEETEDKEFFNAKVQQISIFMSPVNVHINWYPISGRIIYSKYHPGKYLVAWHPKSSTDNERHSIVIENPIFGNVLVKQIAGALARRIVNYAKVDGNAEQSQEMGFIKFGSRVDLLIPMDAKIEVELGQKTVGGQTIIATMARK